MRAPAAAAPPPATVASSLAADVRVFAICASCQHDTMLDLPALVAAGRGVTALLALPLRCARCGKRGHSIIVEGRHPGWPR